MGIKKGIMRADRLIAIILHLQSNRRMTARALSRALEVTERTIYRDMVALSSAGIPVYSVKGPQGGYALIDDFKATFTAFTEEEIKALFLLGIPPHLVQLGMDNKVKSALLKLAAAFPETRIPPVNYPNQKVFLDPELWFRSSAPPPQLHTIYKALWVDQKLKISYKLPFEVTRKWVVEPYGLVAKAFEWHLVCKINTPGMRVLAVSRVEEAQLSEVCFSRIENE